MFLNLTEYLQRCENMVKYDKFWTLVSMEMLLVAYDGMYRESICKMVSSCIAK